MVSFVFNRKPVHSIGAVLDLNHKSAPAPYFFPSTIATVKMVLRICFNVKTTIVMICTKGFEEIFNKLIGLQDIF